MLRIPAAPAETSHFSPWSSANCVCKPHGLANFVNLNTFQDPSGSASARAAPGARAARTARGRCTGPAGRAGGLAARFVLLVRRSRRRSGLFDSQPLQRLLTLNGCNGFQRLLRGGGAQGRRLRARETARRQPGRFFLFFLIFPDFYCGTHRGVADSQRTVCNVSRQTRFSG